MNEIVFLGIFDKIANWIFSGVSKALTWLVSNVIAPVCSAIWENFLVYIWELLVELVSVILYKLYAFILTVLYAVESAIYSFAGARDVTYNGETGSMLSIFTSMSGVKTAFVYITCISLVLLFLFTAVSVAKTTIDFGYDGKKSVGTIMTSFITSCVTFLILPVFCYGLMDLSGRCMTALFSATSISGGISITDNLYLMSIRSAVGTGTDAISVENYNALVAQMKATEMFWYNLADVKPYIVKASNVDFIVGVIGALLLIINLLGMAAVFIQRVLEVIILYIVSPFFVSTMPLDDGQRFTKWRNTFIGRLAMGVGMIVALNIVMMLLSVVISGSDGYTITFSSGTDYTSSSTANSLINSSLDILLKLVFMIGAIMSVKQAGGTITGIIDQDAAGAEKQSMEAGDKFVSSTMKKATGAAFKVGAMAMAKDSSKEKKSKSEPTAKELKKASASQGFKGDVASKKELDFTKALRDENRNNSVKAAFTKRGSKYAAINNKIDEGNKTLAQFKSLKTHDERAKFIADFNKKGGVNSLKVDGSQFGKSQKTSVKENRQLGNLEKRMRAAKNNRDKFQKGSDQWNKYNDQLNKLGGVKKEFDALNTHGERAAFISKHGEFSDFAGKTSAEKKAVDNLSKNITFAKEMRDALPKGSEEWKELDNAYNELREKRADFSAPMTADEKKKFMKDNKSIMKAPPSKEEQKKILDSTKAEASLIKTRDMFEKDSADWKKYDAEIKNPESAFKTQPNLSGKEKMAVDGITKNMDRVKKLRDEQPQGSKEREFFNDQLSVMAAAKTAFENPNTTSEDREALMENNKDLFENPNSAKVTSAMGALNSKITDAEKNRNMFKEGSDEWNMYNDQIKEFKQEGVKLQSLPNKAAREAHIDANEGTFGTRKDLSLMGERRMKKIDKNIARAQQNRDRHKEGSEGWNKCNGELQNLKKTKAQYASLSTSDARKDFVSKNAKAFRSDLNRDRKLKKLESGYKNWKAIESFAQTPEAKEHAHKMASSYRSLSEQYQRCETDSGREAVMNKAKAYETSTRGKSDTAEGKIAASMGGDILTPKEHEGISKVMKTGNEPAIAQYINSTSHSERSEILKKVNAGEYKKETIPTKREADFKTSLSDAGAKYAKMAAAAPSGSSEAKKYGALSSFCSQAADKYSSLPHHVQREKFADFVTKEINSASEGLEGAPEAPKMASYNQKLAFDEKEQLAADIWFSGNSSVELDDTYKYKQKYYEAETKEERAQVFQDYATYASTATDNMKLGASSNINTKGLSAKPAPKEKALPPKPSSPPPLPPKPSTPPPLPPKPSTPPPLPPKPATPPPMPPKPATPPPKPPKPQQSGASAAAASREERRESVNKILSSKNSEGSSNKRKYVSRLKRTPDEDNSGSKTSGK